MDQEAGAGYEQSRMEGALMGLDHVTGYKIVCDGCSVTPACGSLMAAGKSSLMPPSST
jgi:hypothetical protein